ncbi:uncharacterized protein F5891DRAFT_1239840 [Suillus fuscotomentosus]|uniref:Uncharacterized protein n=1 Tax=Suillus fuscotomentosus TaxID=1912939 RepID=A0AAD4HJY2_9AGAM|nr:uncharacterized protein F5891DRAFT_1239840 [Suillus fuscotomentosus]KAG1898229.1 hypothetical protein F5891DRAFT_1239840 [Suillus fuscotomentosus]
MEARSTPLAAEFPMPGCRQVCLIDSPGPFPEFMDSDIVGPGLLSHSDMSYQDSTSPPSLSNDHSHHYSGTMRASLPDETALFVANYLHQLRLKFGMDMTLDRAIQICIGQWDTPDPKPTHAQMGRDHFVSNYSSPSTSVQSSRSTRQSIPSDRVYFRSGAIAQTDHEIFQDGGRLKVRCYEGSCSGNALMKDNFVRHHYGGSTDAQLRRKLSRTGYDGQFLYPEREVDVLMNYARSVQKPVCLGYHDCEEHHEDDDKKSGYCPHKLRSTVDNEMLYRDLEQTQTLGDMTITCQDIFIMVLRLGGQECAEGNKTSLDSYMLG